MGELLSLQMKCYTDYFVGCDFICITTEEVERL